MSTVPHASVRLPPLAADRRGPRVGIVGSAPGAPPYWTQDGVRVSIVFSTAELARHSLAVVLDDYRPPIPGTGGAAISCPRPPVDKPMRELVRRRLRVVTVSADAVVEHLSPSRPSRIWFEEIQEYRSPPLPPQLVECRRRGVDVVVFDSPVIADGYPIVAFDEAFDQGRAVCEPGGFLEWRRS